MRCAQFIGARKDGRKDDIRTSKYGVSGSLCTEIREFERRTGPYFGAGGARGGDRICSAQFFFTWTASKCHIVSPSNNQQPATMTTLRPFRMDDLFRFNNINLDVLTETYNMPFYLQYISQWPEAFTVAEGPDGSLMGYMLGKAEGMGKLWHGHVSAVTVAPTYRRLGLARTLMEDLDKLSTDVYNAHFVDLFVRASNGLAISMYESFGYVKYRRVLGYYSGDDAEDAWDMRKALPRDKNKESVVPLDHPIRPEDLEW